MQKHIFIVYTNAVEGRDDEYNNWYDDQHLNDVLKIPGVVAAQRFALSYKQRLDPPFPWKYAAIYEIETDNLDDVITPLKEWIGTDRMPRSDAMEPHREAYFFHPITTRREA
ncbi:hypothetical protein ACQKGC_25160 [Allorhizobium pseudoryzae]|jgi:hypothetical protein|uniref:hypothetical protein n=1 Tax=Allorhizobium pseudoryzae TaxID=379684 RepID=UPI003D0491EE